VLAALGAGNVIDICKIYIKSVIDCPLHFSAYFLLIIIRIVHGFNNIDRQFALLFLNKLLLFNFRESLKMLCKIVVIFN